MEAGSASVNYLFILILNKYFYSFPPRRHGQECRGCKFANVAIEVTRTGAKIYKDALVTICMPEGIVLSRYSTNTEIQDDSKTFDG